MPGTFRVNEPRIVAEAVDGEVMVIDLDTGTYYNLREAGAVVWDTLAAGAGAEEAAARVQARYDAAPDTVSADVAAFVAALQEADLIVAGDAAEGTPLVDAEPPSEPQPYETPVLEPYVDLQNLIQLDPILEQDEQGWPLPTEGTAG